MSPPDPSPEQAAETLPHVALAAAARWGDHPAVIEGVHTIGFARLADEMRRAAAGFVHAGLQSGDHVAIWAHNGIDWIIACLGAQAAGGIVIPINTRFKGGEAHYVLARGRARFLIHAGRFLGADYAGMLDGFDLPLIERRVALPTDEAPSGAWAAFIEAGMADAAAVAEAERRLAGLTADDVADILFTSGTTGAPKGVIATHGQNVRIYREWVRATTVRPGDRYATIWPFFHCAGYKSGWLASLIAGSTLYPQAVFDTEALIALIAREKISVLPGPPTLFRALLATPEARSGLLDSLRVTVTGATMVAPGLIAAMRDDLGMRGIFAGYGLTEACGTVTMTDAGDGPEVVATSSGRALPGTELAAMDASGMLLPAGAGAEGEILVRGYNVMQGYLDDPAATAEAIDRNGWLHTGDIGRIDARGYLTITGRKKDIFIVGGFNCYPAEIEDMIAQHPAVAEVAVIGVPDPRLGEVGKAFIILAAGEDGPGEASLIAWCHARMANYKVPRAIAFVTALPRTATGKVQKFRLGQDAPD